ncbi:hypothetical protein AB0H12_30020 [Actinosynnema sp. NPDC023794]
MTTSGVMALVVAPSALRPGFWEDAAALFGAVAGAKPVDPRKPVSYPSRHERERARWRRVHGVPVPVELYEELRSIAPALRAAG